MRAVRESIAILAPVSASSSSSGSESSDDDTAPGQTGTHHHHHHHHVDNSDEEVEELEAKYKGNDRVMFKHRLVGVGMVHAVALVIQVKTHWLSMHACISLSVSLSVSVSLSLSGWCTRLRASLKSRRAHTPIG